ncbi:histidinol dehydrogenase [Gammaproteobacteria bacterium]|jgi:histidinol dehydrogenase|nr:histidinol dehydrogenase [Gammaproteobacteria bacterium]
MMKRLDTSTKKFDLSLQSLLSDSDEPDQSIIDTVSQIISNVRVRSDEALLEYTNFFDRRSATISSLEISQQELKFALERIPESLRKSLEHAAQRIREFHEKQRQTTWSYEDEAGNVLGQKVTPLDCVGVYVPGGKAAYPSSVLMNVIPAHVAGVKEIIMVVPTPDDERNDLVLAAAGIAGVHKIFSIGGAQAIAALAYGTKLVPKVDKIVGPGNIYVATAKRQVFGVVGIDMIAGPSEVVIVSDSSANPDWVAMDLFAQAEHDEQASSILITPDEKFIEAVEESIIKLLPNMERAEIIKTSLLNNGAMIKVKDLKEAIDIVNIIAPEHLELAVSNPDELLEDVRHAGAIFMGHYSAESIGDYCAGPNHVLPTARTARFSSPLSVDDFQKKSSIVKCSRDSIKKIAETASILARGEGLTAHARSAEFRLNSE